MFRSPITFFLMREQTNGTSSTSAYTMASF